MDIPVPTGEEALRAIGPAIAILVLWLAMRRAVLSGRTLLRDVLLGGAAAAIVLSLAAGA